MARHQEHWYIQRLQKHYNLFYLHHDEEVEWFANPEPNQWRFRIPSMKLELTLICDDNGDITTLGKQYEE